MTKVETFKNLISETMGYPYFSTLYDADMWKDDIAEITKALEVLEIIKSKKVDIPIIHATNTKQEYNDVMYQYIYRNFDKFLTDEEYDKVKEWLENEKTD